MTFEQFMRELEAVNPHLFAAERICIRVSSLRSQLERAYRAGAAAGVAANPAGLPPGFEALFGRGNNTKN